MGKNCANTDTVCLKLYLDIYRTENKVGASFAPVYMCCCATQVYSGLCFYRETKRIQIAYTSKKNRGLFHNIKNLQASIEMTVPVCLLC